jgi:hypothetical protein
MLPNQNEQAENVRLPVHGQEFMAERQETLPEALRRMALVPELRGNQPDEIRLRQAADAIVIGQVALDRLQSLEAAARQIDQLFTSGVTAPIPVAEGECIVTVKLADLLNVLRPLRRALD